MPTAVASSASKIRDMLPAGAGVRSVDWTSLVDILLTDGALEVNYAFVLKLTQNRDDLLLRCFDFSRR